MRALARHRLIQIATLFLLAWITVDFCWPDACAGDISDDAFAEAGFSPAVADSGPVHGGLLHPDHCFCHAHNVTLTRESQVAAPSISAALRANPLLIVPTVDVAPLYHPPQSLS